MKIAILGAGACGLTAAILLSAKHDVYVFERNDRPGRKILASGNGKANISNVNIDESFYNNPLFIRELYSVIKPKMVYDFFEKIGIYTYADEEGRIYPYSLSSQNVLDKLLDNCKLVKFHYNFAVNTLNYKNKWYINDFEVPFDHVICATGSIAGIIPKKQNGIYDYLSFLDLTALKPALCGFKVFEDIKALSGFRSKANVKLIKNGQVIHTEAGEVIFKDEGISGIVIMNLEAIYVNSLGKYALELDLLPDVEINDVNGYEISGIVHPKLAKFLEKYSRLEALKILKAFKLNIKGTYDFVDAQVVCGGVSLTEITPKLEYKQNKTLHFGGEVIDVNGRCGGYNLHFAFASGILNWLVIDDEC